MKLIFKNKRTNQIATRKSVLEWLHLEVRSVAGPTVTLEQ